MGLRFEAWTLPSSGTFEKKFDIPHVLPGASGVRELSNYSDESITVPATWKNLPNLLSETVGSLIRVYNGTTLIDEFEPVRVDIPAGRPNVRTISGPQRNGLVEGIGVAPKDYPNHKDGDLHWQWGAKNLLPDLSLAGLGSVREVWEVWHDHTSGQWNVEVAGDDVDIDYDATPGEIEGSNIGAGSGIQGLSTVQDVTVSGEGSEDDPWIITFYNPADPTGVAFTAGTLSGGSTFSATRTTAGALDPSPITVAKPVDQQGGDLKQHGVYGPVPLLVDTAAGQQDGTSEWVLRVDVVSGFGGSQFFPIDVVPGKTYSNITARVKPEDAGRYGLIIRDEFSGDIYRQFQDMTSGSWQDLTPASITIPAGVNRVLMRVSVDDDDTPTTFRVNWQHATFLEGDPEATFTQIIRELLEAAQARNVGTWLEIDGSDSVDSNGTALDAMSFTAFVGDNTHLGHVLEQGRALGYQWRIVPADEALQITPAGSTTHVLQIFYIGADEIEDLTTTPGVAVTVGDHVRSAQLVTRRLPYTSLIGLGAGDLSVEDSNATAEAGIGRIERIRDVEHLASTASIQAFLDSQFADMARNQRALSATVVEGSGFTPLVDYGEGSKIWWQFPGIAPKEARPVKRVAWIHDTTPQYQLQGSWVLTGESALAAGVDRLLRQPGRRREDRVGGSAAAAAAQGDAGAHLHMVLDATQEIAAGGAAVEFTRTHVAAFPVNFESPSYPTTDFVVQQDGYYNVGIHLLRWETWTGGGRVWVTRTRIGDEVVVYPDEGLTVDGWTSDSGDRFVDGVAHAIPCHSGDVLRVYVDHGDESPQDLAEAEVAAYLVDEYGVVPASTSADVDSTAYHDVGEDVHVVPLPATQAGDLLVASASVEGPTTELTMTGWTPLDDIEGSIIGSAWWYKVADGSEGATMNVPASSSTVDVAMVVCRVRSSVDYASFPPDIQTVDNTAGSFTFPNVSPSHGAGRYLVFASASVLRWSDPSGPPGYQQVNITPEFGAVNRPGIYVSSAVRLVSSSVGPGDITFGGGTVSPNLHQATIAVKVE